VLGVQLQDAVRRDDTDAAARLVHAFKGAAANLGGMQAAALAAGLELAFLEGRHQDAARQLPAVVNALEALLESMRPELARPSAVTEEAGAT